MISFEEFKKTELRIGQILEAEKIENAEKLLKLQVDLGEEKRQIVAGLAKSYNPEELIGMQVLIVANLEPRELMGYKSEGMVLIANDEIPVFVSPIKKVKPGALLS